MSVKHLLSFKDWSQGSVEQLLENSYKLKTGELLSRGLLESKTMGMIFEKPSNRTRISFEVGLHHLGGKAIYIKADEVGIGVRESVEDIARVFSRYLDAVVIRNDSHSQLEKFAQFSSIPVINGLSDMYHPCQGLADMLTIFEQKKRVSGIKITYIGDGNNVCRSLLEIGNQLGLEMTVCSPEGYDVDFVDHISFNIERDPNKAVQGVDVVYTDVWTSMGQEEEKVKRLHDFKGYQITSELLSKAASDVMFLHCLPAHRGEEVSSEVMESSYSYVFDQAENRLHAQKAIMLKLMS